MMIPYPVTMVPTFILFNKLKWVNTFLPLIVPPYFAPGVSTSSCCGSSSMTINRELDEAAEVDGAEQVPHLLADHPAPRETGAGHGRDLLVHVLLERLHGAVDLPERQFESSRWRWASTTCAASAAAAISRCRWLPA